jgi:hypothetical protein
MNYLLDWVVGWYFFAFFGLNFFTANRVKPPDEVAPATMTAIVVMQTGHMVISFSFIYTTNELTV